MPAVGSQVPQEGTDTAAKLLNQNINKLTTTLGGNNTDLVGALQAIAAAINAKPSA